MIYVCDNCGEQSVGELRPGQPYECDNCRADRAWEFPPDRSVAARHHGSFIRDRMQRARSFGLLNDGRLRV